MRNKVWLLHILTSFIAVSIFLLAHFGGIFNVREIDCTVEENPCPEEISNQLSSLRSKSYFFTNFADETHTLLGNGTYSVLEARQVHPWKIEIKLTQIGTQYQLVGENGEKNIVLPNGKTEPGENMSLAQISTQDPKAYITNSYVHEDLHKALSILVQELQTTAIKWKSITVESPQKILIELETNQRVIIDTTLTSGQISLIPQIVAHSAVQELTPGIKEIDLRFNLPVLRTEVSGD